MTPLATAAAPILQTAQLAAENGPALLAIDGRCGSGKSTLAEFLAGQLGCRVVHTDDFYLPLAARCTNWQEQPGEYRFHSAAKRGSAAAFARRNGAL